MKLKTDEEYKKIDEEDEKSRKESLKSFSKYAKRFDEGNRYWIEFIKTMPEGIQSQIILASVFPSNAVMLWLSVGDAKERDLKLQLIEEWRKNKNPAHKTPKMR